MALLLEFLGNSKLVLASSSPQRKKLLEQIGLEFRIFPSPFDEETVSKTLFKNPRDYVKFVAHHKALAVAKELSKSEYDCIVIGADTVIVHNGQIIGKPHTAEVAVSTLQKLNNKTHIVCTGVSMIKVTSFSACIFDEVTKVKFGDLAEEEIQAYVDTGESLNKAGAYGIQGRGAVLVESIEGDYNNVVGFPLFRFSKEIAKFLLGERSTSI